MPIFLAVLRQNSRTNFALELQIEVLRQHRQKADRYRKGWKAGSGARVTGLQEVE